MYASFDSTASQPTPVTGWYDAQTPAMLSVPPADILILTQAEWDNRLSTPYVQNSVLVAPPAPSAAQLLSAAQTAQISLLQASYAAAIVAPVTVAMASGVTATFATDADTVRNLTEVLTANAKAGTWKPNYWLDVTGAVITPVTFADLQNIAAAIQNVTVPDNQNLHAKIGQVVAATTPAAVAKITF